MQRIFVALILFAFVMPAHAISGREALASYFESVRTLAGRFEQVTLDEGGGVLEESRGEFRIARPDRFNWFYEAPFPQRLIADGRWLYVYDVELRQVTVRDLGDVLGVGPAVLLSGDFEDVERNFRIESGEGDWLSLLPVGGEWDFQRVRLKMVDGVPAVIEVDDGLGQTTRVRLFDLVRNEPIDEAVFEFTPPAEADVIAPPGYDEAGIR